MQRAKDAGANPYPHKFAVDYSIPEFIEHFGPKVEPGSHSEEVVSIAGRVQIKRASGAKLIFYDVNGGGQKVQIMADQRVSEHSEDADAFAALHSGIKRGDIVGIRGKPGASKKGELSIFPVSMQVRPADCRCRYAPDLPAPQPRSQSPGLAHKQCGVRMPCARACCVAVCVSDAVVVRTAWQPRHCARDHRLRSTTAPVLPLIIPPL